MPVTGIFGGQWGDEGKGRIVDLLSQDADLIIRAQGGDNAGHTVENEHGKFVTHLIPSGIFNPDAICFLGTGMVVNPDTLLSELSDLENRGIDTAKLFISDRAHLVLPHHVYFDNLREDGSGSLGSTRRGISPAYADKALKLGIRFDDILDLEVCSRRVDNIIDYYSNICNYRTGYQKCFDKDLLMEKITHWKNLLSHRVRDLTSILDVAFMMDKKIIVEGQLGVMRDLDWGIYPYCTSSNSSVGSMMTGAGIPPQKITDVIGIVKAYSTSVGGGPFPVNLTDETGDRLRAIGHEYGATTGRPRQCGWFDAVATYHAVKLNGFTSVAVTKLDVLDDFDEVLICVGYECEGRSLQYVPSTRILEKVKPLYVYFPGWKTSTKDIRSWDDLPSNAQRYLNKIEALIGCKMSMVSVGPERSQIIYLN